MSPAGNESNDPGTKGLSNSKFINKLPKGSTRKSGLKTRYQQRAPYLIVNPPPQ